jgi:integrase
MALNSNQVKSLQAGTHADADGLYLVVRETGDRAWAFRFTDLKGKRAQMEFAKVGDRNSPDKLTLTLSTARETARDFKVALKRHGIDPRFKKQVAAKGTLTFKDYAEQKYPGWCVGKSKDEPKQWMRSIRDVPSLHLLRLHEIDVPHILDALKPIWWEKPVTADRTRQRIEKLLDAAKVEKLRTGDNPAAWRGNLKFVLPSARKLNKKKPHPSVAYAKAPALMTALRYDTGMVARCVEVGILTVARSQEIRLMEWTEIDFAKKTWLCPAEKMKIKGDDEPKDHLVPLSDQAIEIIRSLPKAGRYVFPSDHADEHAPFLPNALTACIKRAGFKATMHGMRSTFRNWGGDNEAHNFRREVLEHCLAHREGSETEASYWTGEMRERRRIVLQAWADYVMPIKAPKSKKPSLTLVA